MLRGVEREGLQESWGTLPQIAVAVSKKSK